MTVMGRVRTVWLYCIDNVDTLVAVIGCIETKGDVVVDFFSVFNNCLRRFEK